MNERLHILFAGGGTGGHLFPGLAVAEELQCRVPAARLAFCGTGREWERTQVVAAGYEYRRLSAAPLVASPLGVLRALYSNGIGYHAACRAIRAEQPDLVVGLGGYSSVPLGLAAARQGVPLVLLEQNVIAGRANRLLGRWSTVVCMAFEAAGEHFSVRPRLVWTGNPVRRSILEQAAARANPSTSGKPTEPVLIILGGSQGAHSMNCCIVESLPRIAPFLRRWHIVHQVGGKDVEWIRAAYDAAKLRADVAPFIQDMAELYGRASLAICRAGATTLAELAVVGVPAILVPYPLATANHQWHNAQAFGRAGAAVVIEDRPEPGRSAAILTASLLPLVRLRALRTEMRLAMLQLAQPAAAAVVVSEILSVLASQQLARQSA